MNEKNYVSRSELLDLGFQEKIEIRVNEDHSIKQYVRYMLDIAINTRLFYQPEIKGYEWYLVTFNGQTENHCPLHFTDEAQIGHFMRSFYREKK